MLYKCPGPHDLHGVQCDYQVVDEDDIEREEAEGWHRTIPAAHEAYQAAITALPPPLSAPPMSENATPENDPDQLPGLTEKQLNAPATYDEMKAQATQMGLEYHGNISKAALLALINAKLAEQG